MSEQLIKKYNYSGLMHNIKASAGSTIKLPFHLSSPFPGDSVRLILWFKDSAVKPVYSVDARGNYHP
jgi:hypothetical protein